MPTAGPNLFVYGRAATGKTACVRAVLQLLKLRHAVVMCDDCAKPRQLFGSLLAQLGGSRNKREDAYAALGPGVPGVGEFLSRLSGRF
jgi:Cdc6-like AAA superfamily ATPase